jgi:hypothetical protein
MPMNRLPQDRWHYWRIFVATRMGRPFRLIFQVNNFEQVTSSSEPVVNMEGDIIPSTVPLPDEEIPPLPAPTPTAGNRPPAPSPNPSGDGPRSHCTCSVGWGRAPLQIQRLRAIAP